MRYFVLAVGALALSWVGGGPARAADPSPELIKQAAATNGGEIALMSALFDATNQALTRGFNAKFGKDGLQLKVVRFQTGQQVQLYDQELRAGKVSADLMFFVEPPQFLRLARESKLTPYCSANFADYRPEARAADCTHFNITSYVLYLGYNTDLVKAAEAPTSWMDLVDPKWKGKVSIPDPKIGGGHYYFVFAMYKLFGKEWFEKARLNDALLTSGYGISENQLMSGERHFAANISVLVRNDGQFPGAKGAPVMEAYPKEGAPLLAGGLGITKGGPNLPGAKVFVDWVTSLEGQQAISRNGLFSFRKDFTSREGDDLSKLKYLWFDADEMDKMRDQYTQESIRILTAR